MPAKLRFVLLPVLQATRAYSPTRNIFAASWRWPKALFDSAVVAYPARPQSSGLCYQNLNARKNEEDPAGGKFLR
jgi:hypothetical protein